jgi:hypothetical protein
VTAIDKEILSKKIILKHINKLKHKKLKFIHGLFSDLNLRKMYSYILSINSIPFMNKTDALQLMNKISKHHHTGGVLTISFFGKLHYLVKNKKCFGLSKRDIYTILNKLNYDIQLFERHNIKRKAGIFDVFYIIAIKL